MARTIDVIQQQIIDAKNADSNLSAMNSPSQTTTWLLWSRITAVSINLFEQLLDVFTSQTEAKIAKAGAGTLPWLRAQVLKFQYSPTVAQYIQLDPATLTYYYTMVDASLQILTRASVVQLGDRTVNVKVAKSEPPTPLSAGEKTALQSFLDEIRYASTQIKVVTANADSLIVGGTVFYTGQFSATIKSDLTTALNNYCTNLSSDVNFGSSVKATDVIKIVLGVQGVTDFKPTEISVRPDGIAIGSRSKIFELSSGTDNVSYSPVSGYIVEETTTGYTFSDTLIFTPVS